MPWAALLGRRWLSHPLGRYLASTKKLLLPLCAGGKKKKKNVARRCSADNANPRGPDPRWPPASRWWCRHRVGPSAQAGALSPVVSTPNTEPFAVSNFHLLIIESTEEVAATSLPLCRFTPAKLRSGTWEKPQRRVELGLCMWGENLWYSAQDTQSPLRDSGDLVYAICAIRPRLGGPRRSPPPCERCLRTKSQGRAGHPACDPVEPGGGKRAGRRSSARHADWLEPTPIRAPRPDNWPVGAEFAEPQ